MHYVKWLEKEIEGLRSYSGITILYTEVNPQGQVLREVGVNESGEIVHKFPSKLYSLGLYGLFDNQRVKLSDMVVSLTKDEFEKLWCTER